MSKTIFVLLDGCTYEGAKENLGYLEHLIESEKGIKLKIKGELPSMSRPMYETLFTGLPASEHLIVNNTVRRRSKEENIFSLCKERGMKTAAAAYHWVSELYNLGPHNSLAHRIQLNTDRNIGSGIFYHVDHYPDSHLFEDGEFLRNYCDPEFLLIHSMNIDDAGHKFGSHSDEYADAIATADIILSNYLPKWLAEGYNVIVTSDHGMNEKKLHGGNTEIQRLVPLYMFTTESHKIKKGEFTDCEISQLYVAPLICRLLGMSKSKKMKNLEEVGGYIFEEDKI